jgi:hypothetical protein
VRVSRGGKREAPNLEGVALGTGHEMTTLRD